MNQPTFAKRYTKETIKSAVEQLGKDEAGLIAIETFDDLKSAGFAEADCRVGALNMVLDQADAKREAL